MKTSNKNFEWGVTALVAAIVSFYLYKNVKVIDVEKVYTIKAVLTEKPVWGATGGDFTYEYVKFFLSGGNYFELESCSYESADLGKVSQLIVGDSVIIKSTSKLPHGQEYKIASLMSPKYGNILDIKDLNYCESRRWKLPLLLAVLSLVWLIVRVILRYREIYNGESK